jgi:hypothetical protein
VDEDRDANAIAYTGAIPPFADIDIGTDRLNLLFSVKEQL